MTTVAEKFGTGFEADVTRLPIFVAGIECEIEAIVHPAPHVAGFQLTQDGSLRNRRAPKGHGHEYISAPMAMESLLDAFQRLHDCLHFYEDEEPFGPRTSTHVHINCLNLSLEEARTLVLLYALYEEFFFLMVDQKRRGNIHCVPLTETTMPHLYKKPITTMFTNWHKYTALNIKPLGKYGTMEFRHLQGTNNVQLLSQWLYTLENLWKLSQEVKINATNLQDDKVLVEWFRAIFKDAPQILKFEPSMFDIIHNNLLDVKFAGA